MSTTLFYRMKIQIKDRTAIHIIPAGDYAFCHRCKKNVKPNVIVSKFLSLPLSTCPICCSVIQCQEKE